MTKRETRTALEAVANEMRRISLEAENGAMIGSEESLIARISCSRSTMRQAARLLEREGLLKVRRGINGGYFAARPDAGSIEATVSSYLQYLEIDARDVTVVASALWVEAMRKAAEADPEGRRAMAERLMPKVKGLKDNATFEKVRDLEMQIQSQVFELARADYVRLIFDINVTYSRRRFSAPVPDAETEIHMMFVQDWRNSKMLELSAIAVGDVELAGMAAQHGRKIWNQRIKERFAV